MMNQSPQINEIAAALSKFQGEVTNPQKNKQGYNYTYADLASVLEVSRPIMAKYGLSVTQFVTTTDQGATQVETMLLHESGQFFKTKIQAAAGNNGKMSAAQNIGSTLTYLRRYAITALLGIAQDDDDAAQQISRQQYREEISQTPSETEIQEVINHLPEISTIEELGQYFKDLKPGIVSKVQNAFTERKQQIKQELENANAA